MIKFQHVAKATPPNILETRIDLNANITSAVQIYQSRYRQIPSVYLPPIRIVNLHIGGFAGSNQV